MHFYAIAVGVHDEYEKKYIMHEKSFSKSEFTAIYNKAIETLESITGKPIGEHSIGVLIKYLVEHYNFIEVKEVFGIYERGYEFTKVNERAIVYDDVDNY